MVRSGLILCLVCAVSALGRSQAAYAQSYEKAATLSITPAEGLTSSGSQGGPFTPSSRQYTVSNTGDGILAWTAVSSQPWVSISYTPTGAGTKLVVGSQFSASGTVSIPLSLFRGTGTDADRGPSAISAFVTYDTDVLQFQGVTQSSQLTDWYDKGLVAGETTPGRISVVVYGINRYEITTFDDQTAGGDPSQQINPFPLGSLLFSIVGAPGSTSTLGVEELAMTDAEAALLTGLSAQQGLFSASALPGGQAQAFSGDGVATVSFNSNAQSLPGALHTATVTFSSNGGTVTRPVALTVTQACTAPAAPGQVQASDGDFSGYARITWAASAGATEYRVFRSEGTDANAAQALGDWSSATSYNDTSAAAPASSGGCSSSGGFTYYNYWVRARNTCGTSPFSAPDSGYRGSAAKAAKSGSITEFALPATGSDESLLAAEPGSSLSLHLIAKERLAPGSVWARVESAAAPTAVWEPRWSSDGLEVWVTFTPEQLWSPGEIVTVTAGAATASGKPVGPVTQRFQIAVASPKSAAERLWQPIPGVDYSSDASDAQGEAVPVSPTDTDAVPAFAEGRGEPVHIGPDVAFSAPQRVWLPVPKGVDPDSLVLYYYHSAGADRGWYPGERVQGWLVPDSALRLDLEKGAYVGFLVRYGGMAQLGVNDAQTAPAQASVAPLGGMRGLLGDLLVFALVTAFLFFRGRGSRFVGK